MVFEKYGFRIWRHALAESITSAYIYLEINHMLLFEFIVMNFGSNTRVINKL